MTLKEQLEKAIEQWNNFPKNEHYLTMEDNTAYDDVHKTWLTIVTIYIQKVQYLDNGSAMMQTTKDKLFQNQWIDMISNEHSEEECFKDVLSNLMMHGFTNAIKALDDIRKHNPTK